MRSAGVFNFLAPTSFPTNSHSMVWDFHSIIAYQNFYDEIAVLVEWFF